MGAIGRRGISFDPWHICDRCGITVRSSQLVRQRGMWLCTVHGCFDNPEAWIRYVHIPEILSDGRPEPGTWLDDRAYDEGIDNGIY